MAVAGVFALAAAFCALFGLMSLVVDGPWAAAITAATFAAVFAIFALTHKPPPKRRSRDEDEGEHHSPLASAAGMAQHLPATFMAVARRHPAATVSLGALAALIVLRRPAIALMAATHLLGFGRRPRSRWERARDWLPF
jgi:cytochrome c biogenesis factor